MDQCTDGPHDRQTDGPIDQRTDGLTDRSTKGLRKRLIESHARDLGAYLGIRRSVVRRVESRIEDGGTDIFGGQLHRRRDKV